MFDLFKRHPDQRGSWSERLREGLSLSRERLSRPLAAITMGEVLRVLEGPIAPMICATEGEMTEICGFLNSCKIQILWAKVRDAVAHTIDTMSLAELVGTPDPVKDTPSKFIALSDIRVANSATN